MRSKYFIVRTLLIFLLFSVSVNSALPQPVNYREVFGDDWKKAEVFERENRSWIEPLLTENQISYPLAIAIIFPELVRYSALRDKMEITLLKSLYISLGDEYANFSIGQFQMKPSFAEFVRSQAPAAMGRKSEIKFKSKSEFEKPWEFRKSIVADLEDPKTEFRYLIAFFKICEKRFRTGRLDDSEKIKFLATAYNYGIDKKAAQIVAMADKKFFNTKLFKTENYSYADISLFWYREFTGK